MRIVYRPSHGCGDRWRSPPCLLPGTVLHALGPAEISRMRMIDDSEDGVALRAEHDQDFNTIDASVFGAWGFDVGLAMRTFHIGTSDLVSVAG